MYRPKSCKNKQVYFAAACIASLIISPLACAQSGKPPLEAGGKLLLTRGVSSIDGSGGGGVVPWALITGNETERGIGGTTFATVLELPDYHFMSLGGAVGFFDRFEVSVAHQEFDTGPTGTLLGIGEGFTFEQNIVGAKLRIVGDAVYDQDSWMPQIAVGAFYKSADHEGLLTALGAEDNNGLEFYASATKLFLDQSLLINGTLRYTDANQNGLLGFGGQDDASLNPEVSFGYLVNRRLLIGGEYRVKPDNLAFAKEDDWFDLFAAWAVNEHVTLTAAWADLGSVATFEDQRGVYFSLQFGF